jgi:hypothetical protein
MIKLNSIDSFKIINKAQERDIKLKELGIEWTELTKNF